ncbi:MAG TPA: hypothetical protein VEA37_11970 [Flavobacterium sp.]|nr:hypothetical protein [Flavobacterium sp.]
MTNEEQQNLIQNLIERIEALEGQIKPQVISYLPKGPNYRILELEGVVNAGLSGTNVYYVSDSSGGAVNRKLTFTDGILTAQI